MEFLNRRPVKMNFNDANTGTRLGSAIVPEGFYFGSVLNSDYGNDFSPLYVFVSTHTPDGKISMNCCMKRIFEDIVNPQVASLAKRAGGLNQANLAKYMDPIPFLAEGTQFPYNVKQPVPVARSIMPGLFAENRQQFLDNFVNELVAQEGCLPNVKLEVTNAVCDPILVKFLGKCDGRDYIVLSGCEFMGAEYRNAVTPAMMMGGGIGMLAGLFGAAKKTQNKGNAPFGHGREHGVPVDIIRWGFNRLFTAAFPVELEAEMTPLFLRFISSFSFDEALLQQNENMAYQRYVRRAQQAGQLAAQARQMQMMAQQRAIETSRMISQNSQQISAGIMDSWNQKMASDSRISRNYSEAIRGVNTYTTPTGGTVEASVTADHVYQNNYGDVYGVSGSALDQDLLNRLNWTELGRR